VRARYSGHPPAWNWHDLPFGKLLAHRTDGRPVTMWPNIDQAFLDVVNAIKRALNELGKRISLNKFNARLIAFTTSRKA